MGYYTDSNREKRDILEINTSFDTNIEKLYIFNNESIVLDLGYFKDDYVKIVIDYGDGNKEQISKPINVSSGAISVETQNWAKITHYYAFKSEDDFTENKNIVINIYSIDENKFKKYTIPYKVEKNVISGVSRSLSLINANIRNDGKMSYVIQNDADRQIIFLTTEN